jgi:anti-anti-sigma factor
VIHPPAEVRVDDQPGVRVAEVSGVLDVFSAGVVGARILAGLPADSTELVLDLASVEFMDSAGVSALVRLREHARVRDLDVHARLGSAPHMNPTVCAVLRRVLTCDEIVMDDQDDRSPVNSTG